MKGGTLKEEEVKIAILSTYCHLIVVVQSSSYIHVEPHGSPYTVIVRAPSLLLVVLT